MLARWKTFFVNLPLKRKILIVVSTVSTVLFSIAAVLGLHVITKANNRLLYSATAASLSYSATDVQRALDDVETLSRLLITDSVLQAQLSALKQAPQDVIVRGEAYRQLNQILQNYYEQFFNSNIDYISLYSENMSLHTNTIRAGKLAPEHLQHVLETGLKASGAAVWIQDYCIGNDLFLSRAARRIMPMALDTLGIVNIGVHFDKIIQSRTNLGGRYEKAYYLVMDENGNSLYRPATVSDDAYKIAKSMQPDSYKVLKLGDERFFAVCGNIPKYNWKYISLVSYQQTQQAIWTANILFLTMVLVAFLLSYLLCGLLINRITAHFDTLINKMHTFGANKTALVPNVYDYTNRKDEIGQLHRQFDDMAQQIIHYIDVDYKNKLITKDAQLKALESQIDPHFLYNVLASISWRAQAIGENDIDDMVQSLSKLLRVKLNSADEVFTLRKELELVQSYMTIQQIRFEDELHFQTNVPADLLDATLPKLSVQPLVENAIRYGLEENAEACYIQVSASLKDENLWITVSNSGSQFEQDLLQKLENNETKAHGFGIGLVNVQKRIRLMFGEQYGLQFSNQNGMAVVEMCIPYRPTT
ncbi:MAG: histidine kinase [Ruthenibacterium sp.]